MSLRQFLNSRMGFAGVASLLCGASYFLGIGLAEDARIRQERQKLLDEMIEQRVEEQLRKERLQSSASNSTTSKTK